MEQATCLSAELDEKLISFFDLFAEYRHLYAELESRLKKVRLHIILAHISRSPSPRGGRGGGNWGEHAMPWELVSTLCRSGSTLEL